MVTNNSGAPLARLEARIPTQIYEMMQRAARLRGLSLTSYLIATVGEDARRVVAEAELMQLSREDQLRIAEDLLAPPTPNEQLKRAARLHAELIVPR